MGERRAALAGQRHVRRQQHRELALGHADRAAAVAVHDRDRGPPVALPRDAPVLEPEVDARVAEALLARVAQAVPAGGYFISKTPCLGARGMGLQGAAMRLMIPLMQVIGKAPPVIRFFSTEGLEAAITRAGFEVVEAGSFPGGKPPSHYIVARRCS